jgi:DNA-binding CsgD family transcriptional regulator
MRVAASTTGDSVWRLTVGCNTCRNECTHGTERVRILDKQLRIIWACADGGITVAGMRTQDVVRPEDLDVVTSCASRCMETGTHTIALARDSFAVERWWFLEFMPARDMVGEAGVVLKTRNVCKLFFQLSDGQRDALRHLSIGRTPERIAVKTDCTVSTVRTHLARAKEKLGLLDLAELVNWSVAHGRVLRLYRGSQILQ